MHLHQSRSQEREKLEIRIYSFPFRADTKVEVELLFSLLIMSSLESISNTLLVNLSSLIIR